MENEVWNKVAQFLKELRCEDIDRNSYLELPRCKKAIQEKNRNCAEYENAVRKVGADLQKKIQMYVDAVEICAEEENQQAYLQGIVDGMLMMAGMGLLTEEERVREIISKLKE